MHHSSIKKDFIRGEDVEYLHLIYSFFQRINNLTGKIVTIFQDTSPTKALGVENTAVDAAGWAAQVARPCHCDDAWLRTVGVSEQVGVI